jgi:hypothetical protein
LWVPEEALRPGIGPVVRPSDQALHTCLFASVPGSHSCRRIRATETSNAHIICRWASQPGRCVFPNPCLFCAMIHSLLAANFLLIPTVENRSRSLHIALQHNQNSCCLLAAILSFYTATDATSKSLFGHSVCPAYWHPMTCAATGSGSLHHRLRSLSTLGGARRV